MIDNYDHEPDKTRQLTIGYLQQRNFAQSGFKFGPKLNKPPKIVKVEFFFNKVAKFRQIWSH